jgi:CheY-like chemotaxis protein
MRADPSPRPEPAKVAHPVPDVAGTTRAVLAEDSALFREGLTRLLADAGYDVVATAPDAGELLAQVRAHRPAVVLTDIRMPPTHTTEGLVAGWRLMVPDKPYSCGDSRRTFLVVAADGWTMASSPAVGH